MDLLRLVLGGVWLCDGLLHDSMLELLMRAFPVVMPSGQRYWTVLDDGLEVVPVADHWLRNLRFGRDRAELTTSYAGGVTLYLRWCKATGRQRPAAGRDMRLFMAWLKYTPPAGTGWCRWCSPVPERRRCGASGVSIGCAGRGAGAAVVRGHCWCGATWCAGADLRAREQPGSARWRPPARRPEVVGAVVADQVAADHDSSGTVFGQHPGHRPVFGIEEISDRASASSSPNHSGIGRSAHSPSLHIAVP